MSLWPITGTFTPEDGRHSCQPLIAHYDNSRPKCMYCDAPMTRIVHAPDHKIDGRPCGYPASWRFCFRRTDLIETAEAIDFWKLPTWVES